MYLTDTDNITPYNFIMGGGGCHTEQTRLNVDDDWLF